MTRIEHIGEQTLILGDCREVMPTLGRFDACVTDPPWGLGELSGSISKERNRNDYDVFDDTEENTVANVIPAIIRAMGLSNGRALIACGQRCLFHYPMPRTIGGFYCPAAVGMSPWGFIGYNPVLFYGKDPRDGKGQNSTMTTLTEKSSCVEHPCAKPIGAMRWMVSKATIDNETILDPFMGSGTTLVACQQLGRKGTGIEISEKYFDIACKRVEQAAAQPRLFTEPKQKHKQEAML